MSSVAALSAGFSVAGSPNSSWDGASVTGSAGNPMSLSVDSAGGVFFLSAGVVLREYWFVPAVNNVGSRYWGKFTLVAGSVDASSSAFGVVASLADIYHYQFECVAPATPTATIRIQIYSDSGGTTLVADGTVTITDLI